MRGFIEFLAKFLAFAGTLMCAIPFFTDTRHKRAMFNLERIRPGSEKMERLIDRLKQHASRMQSAFRPRDFQLVRWGLVLACVSFLIEVVLLVWK